MAELKIDGVNVKIESGMTILEAARTVGIEIPALCWDPRLEAYGSCGICSVEAVGMPRLLRACSTLAQDGMQILTNSERVRESRKGTLELLLSDHRGDCRPPCMLACPAKTDCQGYVGLAANGLFDEALSLIREKIPLPASIGRVCPHPCEQECRRKLVEEPIAIMEIKRTVADIGLGLENLPPVGSDTGKKIAILGGGPGGLSAAWFLRLKGHEVAIYDTMPQMGGMLRYGIPEYRLPKAVLDKEIKSVEALGVKLVNDTRVGVDISFQDLRDKSDAVLVAIGAWKSSRIGCAGEDMDGVIGGIEFLRGAQLGTFEFKGGTVAVVGGGNTAMDACRTAVRLGAEKVYVVYRRTRKEMPADALEIEEAMEEGVEFKFLYSPIEIFGEDNKAKAMRLQVMELGAPDARGRRSPVPVEGKEEILNVDLVIAAIGQKTELSGFSELPLTRWKTIDADPDTFQTTLPGVFAFGDAVNEGAGIAIEAIADAKKAAESVDQFLAGAIVKAKKVPPFTITQTKTSKDFEDKPKISREKAQIVSPEARKAGFMEVSHGIDRERVILEAKRCLECGCSDYFECKLAVLSAEHDANPDKHKGEKKSKKIDNSNPYFYRNPEKCILCGMCARVCDDLGMGVLGFFGRGFGTEVMPALGLPLPEAGCISCGMCIALCPTGALAEVLPIEKAAPWEETETKTICPFCGVGCEISARTKGQLALRCLPAPGGFLCSAGRFGFGEISKERVEGPSLKNSAATIEEASIATAKSLGDLIQKYGVSSVGVSISGTLTSEDAKLAVDYAKSLGIQNIFSFGETGADIGAPLASYEELETADVILAVAEDIIKSHGVAGFKIRQAYRNGAKIVLAGKGLASDWA
ncbi:MAG: FAD-dependent oxidoreductase, partial [Clostridiales bacterium]|nr:FAD-dependent oxidoreductase [Clostridiales bacterium]